MHVQSETATGSPVQPKPEQWPSERLLQARGEVEPLASQIGELTELYKLTDRLYRARSLTDALDAALDAIISTLRCSKASILLFDAAGVMRFVAWRELSAAYREELDGHTPWKAGTEEPLTKALEKLRC